ncbi:MAG: NYN domain-containing protein [Firmicutes bacterium]|nr:NYN domain-containing protein [Bacillota bacterium]
MKKLLIVDGYNLIYTTERYKKWRESDLELARIKLIEDLATLQTQGDYKVILVFDAAKTGAASRQHAEILGIDVWFTRTGETADRMIEQLVHQGDHEGDIVVATSDYTEQKVIFKPGVLRKSSRELLLELESTEKEIKSLSKKGGKFRLEERLDNALRTALERIIGIKE